VNLLRTDGSTGLARWLRLIEDLDKRMGWKRRNKFEKRSGRKVWLI